MISSMDKLRYSTTNTPDGDFHIIVDADNVARASGFGDIADLKKRLSEDLQSIALERVHDHLYERLVAAYYNGDMTALDTIPRTQTGSEFQKKVWQAMSEIPYGKTISYKQLAEKSGNPAAIRAAGTICGLNRLILLVPCHRVLKSDGTIGNYLYGSIIKESLLRREKSLLGRGVVPLT